MEWGGGTNLQHIAFKAIFKLAAPARPFFLRSGTLFKVGKMRYHMLRDKQVSILVSGVD
jgi:hypothetical protein